MSLKTWILRRAAQQNTLARPLNYDDIYRRCMEKARREMGKQVAGILRAPLPYVERLRRIATCFNEPFEPDAPDVVPVRESTPPPLVPIDPRPVGARQRAEWHKDVSAMQHTRPEIPGVWPWKAMQRKPGQP